MWTGAFLSLLLVFAGVRLGYAISTNAFIDAGSSSFIRCFARVDSAPSVVQMVHCDSPLPLRTFGRSELPPSTYGCSQPDSLLPVLDFVLMGFSKL